MRGFFGSTAALLGILVLSSAAWAQQQADPYYGPHMWGDGWWMFAGPVMMIVFIAAIVVVVHWFGGSGHGGAHYPPSGKTPLDILKERFAHGEIDKDAFEESRSTLGE